MTSQNSIATKFFFYLIGTGTYQMLKFIFAKGEFNVQQGVIDAILIAVLITVIFYFWDNRRAKMDTNNS